MKATYLALSSLFHIAQGQLEEGYWKKAGPNDFRGPCPMMNTLANHGFLPRDGRNITVENAVHALVSGLNFDSSLAAIMWQEAVIVPSAVLRGCYIIYRRVCNRAKEIEILSISL
ncbi:Cloroperoxidase [Pseudovirgaria hyperparasitica]|uniref:Cloroperoxidase n=1 Tax=Pseudovirgaria hyperparasitica TaxID=470096 RepID=A0A6A6WE09_9PEZI|nr:Cloroperoxidase [Pseudovirgaria hyperparasitica]KAF2760419.1 Cloroperoxidase [Pseudovirgaria hyperparasitica]